MDPAARESGRRALKSARARAARDTDHAEEKAMLTTNANGETLVSLMADVEHRYRAAQALEEIPNTGEPSLDEPPQPMSRPALIALSLVIALVFAAAAIIGLARLAQRMGPA